MNKKVLIARHLAKIKYPLEAFQMRLFHLLWFCALVLETSVHGQLATGYLFYFYIMFLILAQFVRWFAIYTLTPYWSVDIYDIKNHPIIKTGPYAYLKHPNYLAVIAEFIVLPLLLGCQITLIVGTLGNIFILQRRIKLEESSLAE
jgi:methyltransferase